MLETMRQLINMLQDEIYETKNLNIIMRNKFNPLEHNINEDWVYFNQWQTEEISRLIEASTSFVGSVLYFVDII